MNLLGFLKKKKEKTGPEVVKVKPVNTDLLTLDFFCQLTYMAAIATSDISRSGLFTAAAKLPYESARYFKKVDFVAKAFNHDYAEACNIVGQAITEPEVKELLLRMSGALSSGEDIAGFLEREANISSESYSNQYERKLDTLSKWTDAYIALIMTSAIVTVMAVVTLMIGNATTMFILVLSVLTIVITIAGAWLIHRATPKENRTHTLATRSSEQNLARHIAKVTMVVAPVVLILMIALKMEIGLTIMAAGICLFPLGLISKIDDVRINKRDLDISGFLRSLGGVSGAIGATVNEAIGRLDFRSLGSLKKDANLLYTRILARIDPDLCWQTFVGETGSEQVNRSVRIFWDAVAIGGEPQRVGDDASEFAMKISLLRAKRGMIGSGFLWLTLTMHVVLVVLLVFVYQTLLTFTNLIEVIAPDIGGAATGAMSFMSFVSNSSELGLLYFMILVIIFVLAVSNAFATYSINGGHAYCFAFYISLTLVISGVSIVAVPPVVNMLFSGIM